MAEPDYAVRLVSTVVSPLRWRVLIGASKGCNAAFLQRQHAEEHFERCVNDLRDLPDVQVRLVNLNDDGSHETVRYFGVR